MSRITLTVLCIVIGGIVVGMAFELPQLANGVGAFIVFALVYCFVVAKREAALMSLALEEQREEERERREAIARQHTRIAPRDQPIVPEWQRTVPGKRAA
jgi:hypothetical protein